MQKISTKLVLSLPDLKPEKSVKKVGVLRTISKLKGINEMNFTDILISSVSSTALVSILAFLARNWISERLKQGIKHEYDLKLKDVENKYDKEQIGLKANFEKEISIYQYKLEQVHPKRIQLIEKLNAEIRELDQEIDFCIELIEIAIELKGMNGSEDFSERIFSLFEKWKEFSKFATLSELYLSAELIGAFKKINECFRKTTAILLTRFRQNDEQFNKGEFSKLSKGYQNNRINIEEFFKLSRIAVNENVN